MAGETKTHEATDSADAGEGETDPTTIPIEFLRAQNPSSLPLAKLKLKMEPQLFYCAIYSRRKAFATVPG